MNLIQTWKTSIKQYPSLSQQDQKPSLNLNTVRGILEGLFSGCYWSETGCGDLPSAIQCYRPRGYVLPQVCSQGTATTLQRFCPKKSHLVSLGVPLQVLE